MYQDEIMLKIENVSKIYKLGEIGGTTLRESLQRTKAKLFRKEDPTKKIGAKNYNKGEKFKALDDISFEVKKGERIGIIGHNGAGKSTLLKLISRVTGPTSGLIYLNGRVASMLEVGTGFHPELTGRENIYMNGAILGMTKKEIDAKMENIIEFSEVRQFIDTPVKRYSSGMYVKLAFSVAAHLDSEIIIMDEVLAVGDVSFQNKCIDKMNEISREQQRTILYVSHNMATIKRLCNRVIVLKHGKIVFSGDVNEGISYYLSNEIENDGYKLFYNLKNIKRPKECRNDCLLKSLEFIETKEPVFERGKLIRINVFFISHFNLANCKFRLTIVSGDGTIIGTLFSNRNFDLIKNQNYESQIAFDTFLLAAGKYFLNMSIVQINDNGELLLNDHVYNACAFTVVETNSANNISNWSNQWWGHIHYPDCRVDVHYGNE